MMAKKERYKIIAPDIHYIMSGDEVHVWRSDWEKDQYERMNVESFELIVAAFKRLYFNVINMEGWEDSEGNEASQEIQQRSEDDDALKDYTD
jgi:hypothetical protein